MNTVFLSLGSNMGNKAENLNKALELIAKKAGIIEKKSSVYETEPWGIEDQPRFLNMVIQAQTLLTPQELIHALLEIEKELGRIRKEKWAERIIDIDILFYNNAIIHETNLTIPHPYMHQRRFVLVPMHEIAPDFFHPLLHASISDLLVNCTDNTNTIKL